MMRACQEQMMELKRRLARLLVEKTKVASQLTLAVALSNSILRRDDV